MNSLNSINNFCDKFDAHQKKRHSCLGFGRLRFVFRKDRIGSQAVSLINQISRENNYDSFNYNYDYEKVQKLFFTIVPQLPKKSREEIHKAIGKNKDLQNYLDDKLKTLRDEKLQDKAKVDDPAHRLNRKIAKARFALKLGVKMKMPGTGISGSKFLMSVKGKKLGLLKPSEHHIPLWKKVFNFVKYILRGQRYFLKSRPESFIEAEKAAYIVSYQGNFGTLVPPTTLETFDGIEGSFMLMAKAAKGNQIAEFKKIRKAFEKKGSYDSDEIDIFQLFAIYDYVINNLDRHDRNWMVEYKDEDGVIKLIKIHAIDHDKSFTKGNPSRLDKLGMHNQYKWCETAIAQENMTENTRRFIRDNLTEENILNIIDEINCDEQLTSFMTPEMENRMKEKAAVLRKIADEPNSEYNLAYIGFLRTGFDINKFLAPSTPDCDPNPQ